MAIHARCLWSSMPLIQLFYQSYNEFLAINGGLGVEDFPVPLVRSSNDPLYHLPVFIAVPDGIGRPKKCRIPGHLKASFRFLKQGGSGDDFFHFSFKSRMAVIFFFAIFMEKVTGFLLIPICGIHFGK